MSARYLLTAVAILAVARAAMAQTAAPAGPATTPVPAAAPNAETPDITPTPEPAPDPSVAAEPVPPPPPPPPEPPPAPPPPPEPPRPRFYGDRGTSELAVGLGYSSYAGFLGAAGYRYFVVDGVAPGAEASYVSGGTQGLAYGLLLASVRVVPLRTPGLAVVLTGRGGRVLMGHHPDGWAAGGSGGVILLFSGGMGLELGYEVLRLLPASFCAGLTSCVLHGPVFGVRLMF